MTTDFKQLSQLWLPCPIPRIFQFLPGLILLFAAMSAAQVGSASLSGVVLDPSGAAVIDATVTLESALSASDRVVKSNGAGAFFFAAVPSGDYNLKVEKKGFSNYIQKSVPVSYTHLDVYKRQHRRHAKCGQRSDSP